MQLPRAVIDEIRERTDIVDLVGQTVTLRGRGNSFTGLCPFHQEKTPSFHVLRHKQIYHCFGCKESGDVFTFLMKTQGLSFAEAVKELAGPAGVTLEEKQLSPEELHRIRGRASLHDACEAAAEWFHTNLMTRPEGADARTYLKGRGITTDTIRRFRLGYAPDRWTGLTDHLQTRGLTVDLCVQAGLSRRNAERGTAYDFFRDRVMIPILDRRDRPIAFGGRLMQGEGPKYINSSESDIYEKSMALFGLSHARAAIQRKDRIIVVEGYFDVISVSQAGFEEVVATCGTALTAGHLQALRRLTTTVIALFDSDEAGLRAAERALPMFLEAGVEARHLELPGAKDPDEYIVKFGGPAFEERLAASRPLLELVVSRLAARHGSSPGGRQRAVQEVLPLLRKLPPVQRSDLLVKSADLLGVREAVLRELLGRDGAEAPGRAPTANRFVGTPELNRLIWLLLHYPQVTAPALLAVPDPSTVTDREDLGFAIHQLLQGQPLAAVLEQLPDPDLQRLLGGIAAREGLCGPEQAPAMVQEVLARLELRAVNNRLYTVRQELSACDPNLDRARYLALLSERANLQRRREALTATVGPML